VARVVDNALDRFGTVDVVVNNAGGQFSAAAEEISVSGWRAVHRLGVEAAWSLTREVARRSMIPGGAASSCSSDSALGAGYRGWCTRGGARRGGESGAGLAIEWSKYGIRAVCVDPGNIRTEGLDSYGSELVAEWERSVPLGRLGTAEEVATLIAFSSRPERATSPARPSSSTVAWTPGDSAATLRSLISWPISRGGIRRIDSSTNRASSP